MGRPVRCRRRQRPASSAARDACATSTYFEREVALLQGAGIANRRHRRIGIDRAERFGGDPVHDRIDIERVADIHRFHREAVGHHHRLHGHPILFDGEGDRRQGGLLELHLVGAGAVALHYVELVGALLAHLQDLGQEADGTGDVHRGGGVGVAVDDGHGGDLVAAFGGHHHLRVGLDAGQARDDLAAFAHHELGDVVSRVA